MKECPSEEIPFL